MSKRGKQPTNFDPIQKGEGGELFRDHQGGGIANVGGERREKTLTRKSMRWRDKKMQGVKQIGGGNKKETIKSAKKEGVPGDTE